MTKFSVNRRRVVSIAAALSMMLAASPAVAQTAKRSAISVPAASAAADTTTAARADGRSVDAAPATSSGGATVDGSGSGGSSVNSGSNAAFSDSDAAASGAQLDAPAAAQSSVTCNGLVAGIVGTAGNDVLLGTSGDDVIHGLGGNDVINGNGGNDTICGGDGDDIMNGDNGDDYMDGGEGDDNVQGGRGNDTMNGGPGADIMGGDDDDDTMFGDGGADNMNGGKGNDYMDGGDDADLMSGSNGNDTLLGRGGPDVLNGGPQFDTCDVGPDGSSATKCENGRPAADPVPVSAEEDGEAVDGAFSATDPDGDAVTFAIVDPLGPGEGSVVDNGDGTFTFNPGADFQELAAGATVDVTFGYNATDVHNAVSDTATVTVTVTGVDDPAIANDDGGFTTDEDTVVVIGNVLDNDDDADDVPVDETVSVTGPVNGPAGFQSAGLATVVNNFDGTFSYDPTSAYQSLADGESASDSFGYEITSSNPASGSDTATVSITVDGVNDAPVANDGAADGTGTFSITLTADDPDTSDDLTFNVDATSAAGGTIANLVVDPGTRSATVDYTAPSPLPPGPNPTDSFTFTVSDDFVTSAPGTISIVLGDEGETPPPVLTGVEAIDQTAAEGTGPVDVTVGSTADLVLVAVAPFSSPAVAGDIGDITFTIDTPPGLGSLGVISDIVPNDPSDPVRSAMVTYTAPASAGTTSFVFEACGFEVIGGAGPICDTATVEIDIDAVAPPAPPSLTPLATALNPDTSTTLDLSGSDGSTGVGTPGVCDPDEGRTCTSSRPASAGSDQARHAPGTGPGVYFLLDTTGSMGSSIEQAKDDIQAVIADVKASFPDADFGLGDYRDFPNPTPNSFAFDHLVSLGPDDGFGGSGTDVSDTVEGLFAGEGGDLPEAQFYALDQVLDGSNPAGFDPNEVNVIVLLGDAPAHDRICSAISGLTYDITEQSVTGKLLEPLWATSATPSGVKLVAMSTSTASGGLNADPTASNTDYDAACGATSVQGEPGQATRMADATGGAFLPPGTSATVLGQAVKDAIAPPSDLSYQVLLPLNFSGTLKDSTGQVIPLGVLTTVPDTMLDYSSTGVSTGTQTQFSYTVTSASTNLSSTETFYISVVASFVLPDGCELVGRPPGCVVN